MGIVFVSVMLNGLAGFSGFSVFMVRLIKKRKLLRNNKFDLYIN